jgi:hypothetical protein
MLPLHLGRDTAKLDPWALYQGAALAALKKPLKIEGALAPQNNRPKD